MDASRRVQILRVASVCLFVNFYYFPNISDLILFFYAGNICSERRPIQSLPTLYRQTPYYCDDTVEVTMNLREVSQCPEKALPF